MKKTILIFLTILTSAPLQAQLIQERAVDLSIGYGISAPYDEVDINGHGFYFQGQYVLTLASWIDLRPYAGVIFTQADKNDRYPPEYKTTANAFLLGGKTRITAPIPWVAPYLEIGIGASIGKFETVTPFTDIEDRGLLMHIPFSVGLELGRKHNFDFAFTYYFHESARQFAGAAAFGISLPL